MLGLDCWTGFSLVVPSGDYSSVVFRRLLIVGSFSYCRAWALKCAGFRSCGTELSSCGFRALEHWFSSYSAQAKLLCSMWNLPGSGIKPLSPALAGGFFTTEPPGKLTNLNWFALFTKIKKNYSSSESFYHRYKSFISYIRCKYFLPIWDLSFHSLSIVSEDTNTYFIFYLFFCFHGFYLISFTVLYLRNLLLTKGHKNFLVCFLSEVLLY